MKTPVTIFLLVFQICLGYAQTTNIPDSNFEQALIDIGLDNTIDGVVQTSAIDTVTSLEISNSGIADLTGIEDFSALTILVCYGNPLNSLDISSNIALTYLDCRANALSNLDVTQNAALTYLNCRSNYLSYVDVSQNLALIELSMGLNDLNVVDVSQNIALVDLNVSYNILSQVDVSSNVNLTELKCEENSISELDVSNNSALTLLGCFGNSLTCLNVNNENNTNMTLLAQDNENLTCIEVDDIVWANSNWSGFGIDPASSFDTLCSNACSPIVNPPPPSSINEIDKYAFELYPNPVSNTLNVQSGADIYLNLFDVFGHQLFSQPIDGDGKIDVSHLPNGIYFLRVGEETKKFVISR